MYKLTIDLITAIQSTHQIADKAPKSAIDIYKKDGLGNYYIDRPYPITKDIKEINISISSKTGANECTVVLNNQDARYSPNYDKNKSYRAVNKQLPLSVYRNVIETNNLVHIYIGYGKYLVRKFTGYISNPQINEEDQTIQFNVKDEYSKLQKPVDPVDYRGLIYKDAKASFIISDLFKRAGVKKYMIETSLIEEKDFTIQEYAVDLGTNYDTAIKKLLDVMNHTMKADRFGIIEVKEIFKPDTTVRPDVELSDYTNVTAGQYYLDDTIIRSKIIVQGRNKWIAYRDKFLLKYLNNEDVVMAIDVPWAETDEQMKDAANYYFMQMRRMLNVMTVEAISNPCIDCGDTASLEAWVSATTDKYSVASIETTVNDSQCIDKIELEYIINEKNVAEECEGEYAPYQLEVGEDGEKPSKIDDPDNITLSIQEKVLNTAKEYLDTWYQHEGNKYQNTADYGFDSSNFIFTCLNTNGVLNEHISLAELIEKGEEVTEDDLIPSDIVFFLNENEYPNNAAFYIGNDSVIGMFNGSLEINTRGAARTKNARCMKASIEGATVFRRLL